MGLFKSLEKRPCDAVEAGPTMGTAMETWNISCSFLYCMVQHTAEWPDYYCIIDLRKAKVHKKSHVTGAVCYEEIEDSLSDYCQEMMLTIYDAKPGSPQLEKCLKKLESEGIEPACIYILQDTLSTFKKRYKFVMSSHSPTEGQFPGPIEYIPKTDKCPAVYTIHRNNFSTCKTLIAYLNCFGVLNVSSKRLFVKTPGILLENVQFDETAEPYDEAISALFKLAGKPANKKKKNILIIDETGCDYGALLCGWLLVGVLGADVETVCEHLTSKASELDPFYTDILREWDESRPKPPPGTL